MTATQTMQIIPIDQVGVQVSDLLIGRWPNKFACFDGQQMSADVQTSKFFKKHSKWG